MISMKLTDAMKTITSTKGLPMGDSFVDINSAEADEFEFKDQAGKVLKKWLIKFDGKEFVIPTNLMNDIKSLHELGAARVRITRTGQKIDTRYTVVKA